MIVQPQSELIREPNLLVPGKKPVGAVKIDWGHPLADGLVFTVLDRHHDTTEKNKIEQLNVDQQANTIYFQGGAVHRNYIKVPDISRHFGDEATIFYLLKSGISGGSLNGCLSEFNNISNSEWYPYTADVLYIGTFHTTRQSLGDSNNVDLGKNHCFAISSKPGASNWKCYQWYPGDIAASRFSATNTTINMTTDGYIGTNTRQSASNYYSWKGNIYATYLWNRALTQDELTSIGSDPYQFLIPA